MLTFFTYALGLLVVAGVLFLIATFVFGTGEEQSPARADVTPLELPAGRPVVGADLRALRLPVTVRGYRMIDTDWLIEEMASALDSRDKQIGHLQAALTHSAPYAGAGETDHGPVRIDDPLDDQFEVHRPAGSSLTGEVPATGEHAAPDEHADAGELPEGDR